MFKIIFCGKKRDPNQWLCSCKKRYKSLRKNFRKKKIFFQLICADKIFKENSAHRFGDNCLTAQIIS